MKKLLLLLSCLATGCGPSDGLFPVEGKVIQDGKPVDGATVAFVGAKGGVLASSTSDGTGTFRLRAAQGENKVSVSKIDQSTVPPEEGDGMMPTFGQYEQQKKKAPKSLIDEVYANPQTSNIVVRVEPGMKPVEVVVNSKKKTK